MSRRIRKEAPGRSSGPRDCGEVDRLLLQRRSREAVARLERLAASTTDPIWTIKRAKIILGLWEGRTVAELVEGVRVPPESIVSCMEHVARSGLAYFDTPGRSPTAREARVERMLAFLENPPSRRSRQWNELTVHYIGRDFSAREVARFREHVAAHPQASRNQIVDWLCRKCDLCQANGRLKRATGTHIVKRMAMDNIVSLLSLRGGTRRKQRRADILRKPEGRLVLAPSEIERLCFLPVEHSTVEAALWREIMERFHYIPGYRIFGAQMRYLVYGGKVAASGEAAAAVDGSVRDDGSRPEHLLGALGFGASAWRMACREAYVGWSDEQRERNLRLIVNNVRFLILPWISSPHLASRILGRVARRLPLDWERRHGYRPVLLETFVQLDRHRGTSYRAANWTQIGTTQGYSLYARKKDAVPKKAIFVYPLRSNFRRVLCGP